jgi:hypothetical protein
MGYEEKGAYEITAIDPKKLSPGSVRFLKVLSKITKRSRHRATR